MPPPTLDYSLGVLIVLLMVFWFTCKCIGGHGHAHHQNKCEGMTGGFYYGNTPFMYGSERDLGYVRTIGDHVVVPNSKTAMRNLYTDEDYKSKSSVKEVEYSDIQTQKQKHLVTDKSQIPAGTTATRSLIQQSQ